VSQFEAWRNQRTSRIERKTITSVTEFNAWNVDATSVVFDHSDIYKGRVASLVADLVYGNDKTRWPKVAGPRDAGSRCRD